MPGETPIIPVMLGDARLAQDLAQALDERGVFVAGFFFPVVPKGQARIRTQMSAALKEADIDFAVRPSPTRARRWGWYEGTVRREPQLPNVSKDDRAEGGGICQGTHGRSAIGDSSHGLLASSRRTAASEEPRNSQGDKPTRNTTALRRKRLEPPQGER